MKTNVLLILSYCILFLLSCQSDTASTTDNKTLEDTANTANTTTTPANNENNKEFFVAIVGDLRVRNEPNTASEVIAKLNYGQKVHYLGEESETKEKLEIRGELKNDSWKKIETTDTEKVTGWVYGGALLKEAEVYTQKENGVFEQKITKATNKEISRILGFDIKDDFYYQGTVAYHKDATGKYTKNGKFELKGSSDVEISEGFAVEIGVEIKGNYKNGQPHGLFERSFKGYEYGSTTTINFEEGNCLWSSIMSSGEGEDHNHREESPKECTFEYIEKRLAEVNGWE